MDFISSPWEGKFEDFYRSITRSAILVSPYITAEPLELLAVNVSQVSSIQFKILTKLDPTSILQGSLDVNAIINFCNKFPETRVSHIPDLHAKIYVADDHTAIITSGNLTQSSLSRNLEYGIRLRDKQLVSEICRSLQEYEASGMELYLHQLKQFSNFSREIESDRSAFTSTSAEIKTNFDRLIKSAQDEIKELIGGEGESIPSIFRRSVRFALRDGPLPTNEIYKRVQSLRPDLCDDSNYAFINGVKSEVRWKHQIRQAQYILQKKNQVEHDSVKKEWKLIENEFL